MNSLGSGSRARAIPEAGLLTATVPPWFHGGCVRVSAVVLLSFRSAIPSQFQCFCRAFAMFIPWFHRGSSVFMRCSAMFCLGSITVLVSPCNSVVSY